MIPHAVLASALAATLVQHDHGAAGEMPGMPAHEAAPMEQGLLGIPHGRAGSGTGWLPGSSPIFAWHLPLGERWLLMFHGNLFAGLDAQGTDRGSPRYVSPVCRSSG